jgi:hypothetical protein
MNEGKFSIALGVFDQLLSLLWRDFPDAFSGNAHH